MELREAVRRSIDAMLIVNEYGGSVVERTGGFGSGIERTLLVSAVRTQLGDAVTERQIWEIADFVPIALARALLQEMGAKLHDHYVRIDSQGRLRTYRRLEDEPVFREASSLALEVAQREGDALIQLAQYSTEFQAINQALHAGSRVENLDASPPILNGPDELCDPLEAAPVFPEAPWWMDTWKGALQPKKPWWKFW